MIKKIIFYCMFCSTPLLTHAESLGEQFEQGPVTFKKCIACHSIENGRHGVGPSLSGIWNSRAGSQKNYRYSSALKNANLIWNEQNLDKYIENPQKTVRGTKMPFAGITDKSERKLILMYLKKISKKEQ